MKLEKNSNSMLFSSTEIPDVFFTEYMSQASGDFIKVYLCLVFLSKYDKDINLKVYNNNKFISNVSLGDNNISVTGEDNFNISEYAHKYMKVLIQEVNNGNINSEIVKDAFEKVYWECSDIVNHLYINIRYVANYHTP